MMKQSLERFQPQALAVFRIVFGLVFLQHGTEKVFGFPAPADGIQPPLMSIMGIGGLMEVIGGLLIVAGLFTRSTAFVLSGQMAVAYWFFHAPSAIFPIQNGGDSAIQFSFGFLLLVFFGPGSLRRAKALVPPQVQIL